MSKKAKQARMCSICGKPIDADAPKVITTDPFLQQKVERDDICPDSPRCIDAAMVEGATMTTQVGNGVFINNLKTTLREEHLKEPQRTHGLVDKNLLSDEDTKKILGDIFDGNRTTKATKKRSISRSSKSKTTNKRRTGSKKTSSTGKRKQRK